MPNFDIEQKYSGYIVAGVDEVGLGPLAGPIVAAACVFDQWLLDDALLLINDSKKLSSKKRDYINEVIINHQGVSHSIAFVDSREIDEIGLANAWKKAVSMAVSGLSVQPNVCLIDGNRNPNLHCKTELIVKGDQKSISISAASIVAKTARDRFMRKIHEEFPEYQFDRHVGYGTRAHIGALRKFGPCKYHRKTFAPVAKLPLDL